MAISETPTRVLLGSGGIATEERMETYRSLVVDHFSGCESVLFVPYASDDHDGYTSRMQGFLGPDGPMLVGIHTSDDPQSAVRDADGIYVGGGNSFLLIRDLHEMGLIAPVRGLALAGAPYLGVSAGSNVACPTMMTTNDMPIVLPPSFESFGIVPFQINPHYHPGKVLFMDGDELAKHYGESRAQRIAEFHRHQDVPVLGMWEGSFVQWDGSTGRLTGRATAFVPGVGPSDLHDGAEFDSELRIKD
jgi:dipeptidase E